MKSFICIVLLCMLFITGCDDGKEVAASDNARTRDIVMMTELKNDDDLIRQYEYYHSKEGCWPEIENAARVSGIQSVKIYRASNRLVMIITVPEDLDLAEMNRKYAESSPRVKEWGELMAKFQIPPSFAEDDQTWVPMDLIHDFSGGKVR